MIYFLLFAILAIVLLLTLPALKGWRTLILGWSTTLGGAAIPLLSQITDYLQTLDWRQYVLEGGDQRNLAVLAIIGALGVLSIILRYRTTGPVGQK
jgi:hypothetical protein